MLALRDKVSGSILGIIRFVCIANNVFSRLNAPLYIATMKGAIINMQGDYVGFLHNSGRVGIDEIGVSA